MKRWPICGQGEGPWRGEPMGAVHPHVEHLAYEPRTIGYWRIQERVRCVYCGAVMAFAVNVRRRGGA